MDPELWELLEEGDSGDEIAAIVRLGQPGVVPKGVRVVAQFGDIATLRLERGKIRAVRAQEGVTSLKAPEPRGFGLAPDLEFDPIEPAEDLSEAEPWIYERRPPSLPETGHGVVIGVVDWGFDFAHPDFRHDDGRTRILALWDQRPPPSPRSPQPYGYGIVYTAEDINHALAAEDPYAALGYHHADADAGRGTHATHVASIAGGNGRGCGLPGVAPEADFIFVHLTTWDRAEIEKLGDSVTLLEAVHCIMKMADPRPWVINLSMGRCGEQHDGTTPVEQGLDAALRSAPGGCIVQSCGNYFQSRTHASGRLLPAEKRTLVWEIKDGDVTPNELEVWYPGRDVFDVEIRSPDGSVSARAALGERASLIADGRDIGTLYHRAYEPNALDNHIEIILYTGGPAGPWELTLIGKDVTDGRFHCWIERDSACPDCQSRFRPEDAVHSSTTGTICNGSRTIAVGAYNPHSAGRELASFSSCGPTRDGRIKPDLTAPGKSILAARSAPRDPRVEAPPWTLMSGTSMAAPHVAGAVACMFEAAKRPLRIEETHNLLLANTERVTGPEEVLDRVGSGYLDITRAVEAARRIGSGAPQLQSSFYRETKGVAVNRENDLSSITSAQNAADSISADPVSPCTCAELSRPGEEEEAKRGDRFAAPLPFQVQIPVGGGAPALALPVGGAGTPLAITVPLGGPVGGTTPTAPPPVAGQTGSPVPPQPLVAEPPATEPPAEPLVFENGDEGEFRRELIELADEAISTGRVHSPAGLLGELLSNAGGMAPARPLGAGHINPTSPAALFDSFTSNKLHELREYFNQFFEVVAFPHSSINGNIRSGDLLVRRALGEGNMAHAALLVTGEALQVKELASMGLRPESRRPGLYAEVIDAGPFPHRLEDTFARRLGDENGRLDYDSLILRTRQSATSTGLARIELAENDAEVVENFPTVEFLDIAEWSDVSHFAESVRQAAVGAPHRYVEREILDSAEFRAFPDLVTLNLMRPVPGVVAPGVRNYQFLLKSRVYYPRGAVGALAGTRAFPVAIIVHGNHGWKCLDTAHGQAETEIMNHLGYEYLQQELARHGIVSMSISTNQANMLGSEVRTRAEFILANLRILNRLNGTAGHQFHNRLDLHQIALIGHSRGGDAVVKAVELNRPNRANFTIRAVCSISPTDITADVHDVSAVGVVAAHTARAVSTDWIRLEAGDQLRYLVLYGSKDGDPSGVFGSGTGFRHYDRATCDRTMIFVRDIAHNRFNTVWNNLRDYGDPFHRFVRHPDCKTHSPTVSTSVSSCGPYRTVGPNCPPFDNDIRSADDHQQLAKEYVGGLLRLALNGEASRLDLFNGLIVPTRNHTVSIQWMFTNMLEIENFDDPAHNNLGALGPSVYTNTSRINFRNGPALPFSAVPHETWALQAAISGGTYRSEIPTARKNFSAFTFLTLRLTSQYAIATPQAISSSPHQNFKVRIFYERTTGGITFAEVNQTHVDNRGVRERNRPFFHQIEFDAAPVGSTRTENVTKICFDTLVIPLRHFRGVNWPEVRAIEFEAGPGLTSPIFMDSLAVG